MSSQDVAIIEHSPRPLWTLVGGSAAWCNFPGTGLRCYRTTT